MSMKNSKRNFSVKISYLEIYNEKIYDLMDKQADKTHKIVDDKKWGCEITGMTKTVLSNFENAVELLEKG